MIRLFSLLAFAALALLIWSVGGADPQRLAAFESGDLLAEPIESFGGPGLGSLLQPGDRVLLRGELDAKTVTRVDGNQVWWEGGPENGHAADEDLRGLADPALLARVIQAREGEGWRAKIKPGDQITDAQGQPTPVEAGAEGLLVDGQALENAIAPEAWLPQARTLIELLESKVKPTQVQPALPGLVTQVLRPDGESGNALRLGQVSFPTPFDDEMQADENLRPQSEADIRKSLVRRMRADLAGPGLLDQDLSLPMENGPSFEVLYNTQDGLELTGNNVASGVQATARRDLPLPGIWSLLPPLIAILLAILLRRPVIALFAGVLGGSWVYFTMKTGSLATAIAPGTVAVADRYLQTVLLDQFRFEIIGFVIAMLAMVGVMTRAGGVQGLMNRIAKLAHDAKRTQIATWLMGLVVFFDDYANTILVGSTMRPLTDRYKVAREKLAYIVDSTAAPVAGLSLFSTWIAFEVSTFQNALPDAGMSIGDGYKVFIQTLPYRFYCLFTLAFVAMIVFSGRDFGPMLRAERRARKGQLLAPGATPMVGKSATELQPQEGIAPKAHVALWPLLTFVVVTLWTILRDGGAFGPEFSNSLEGWGEVLFGGSGSKPLLHGSLAGFAVAVVLALLQGVRGQILPAAWASIRSMGVALVILYLAWMLGEVCADLGTSSYLTVQLGDAIPPVVLPVALFLLAALVAFSTGSSWSTMTILLPLVVGLSFELGEGVAIGGAALMILSIGAVLEGAIFGDHCSPISDTTVMSSIASASDHIDHVRTQMPYALLTMTVAIVVGYLPCAYFGSSGAGWIPYVSLAAGLCVLFAILRTWGGKSTTQPFSAIAK